MSHFYAEHDVTSGDGIRWCDWRGVALSGNATPSPSLESVSELRIKASVDDVSFRDPDYFAMGNGFGQIPKAGGDYWLLAVRGASTRFLSTFQGRLPGSALQLQNSSPSTVS